MSFSAINGHIVVDPQDLAVPAGVNNNVVVTSSIVRAVPADNTAAISGFSSTAGVDGEILFLANVSETFKLTIKHDSSSSEAYNRINTNKASDIIIPPKHISFFKYVGGVSPVWKELNFFQSDLVLQSDGYVYFGDKSTNGTVRIGFTDPDFVFQKRVAGTYQTFNTIGS